MRSRVCCWRSARTLSSYFRFCLTWCSAKRSLSPGWMHSPFIQVKGHWIAAFAVVIAALVAPSSSARSGTRTADRVPGSAASPHRHSQIFTVQPAAPRSPADALHDSGAALPDWSPDGRKIIFALLGRAGTARVVPAVDHERRRERHGAVTSRGLDERARYLPDGRILYYRGGSSWVVANPTLRTFETQRFTSAGPRCA